MAYFRKFGVLNQTNDNGTKEEREILLNIDHIECVYVLRSAAGIERTVIRMTVNASDGKRMEYESAVEYKHLSAALDGYRT